MKAYAANSSNYLLLRETEMESSKNARNQPKDSAEAQKSKNQQQLTQFFRKPDASQQKSAQVEKTSKGMHDQQEERSDSQPHTRQSASRQESSQSKAQASTTEKPKSNPGSLTQTPKKRVLAETPTKRTKADKEKDEDQVLAEAVDDIQQRINQKLKESLGDGNQQANDQSASQDQAALEDSARKLRPRKVENYRQMLEGDEVTKKTIQDEQLEIRKKKLHIDDEGYCEDEEEDMEIDEAQIERASDDEEDEDYPVRRSTRKRVKKVLDDDDEEIDGDDISDGSEEADEVEQDLSEELGSKKRVQKEKAKKQVKAKKQGKERSKSAEHEAANDETVFIDNLPNDENEIRVMLKQVRKYIKDLEKNFFEEEDSEKEEELKRNHTAKNHDQALQQFKQTSHLKQFWCIPLSVNVMNFDLKVLAEKQMKSGGRLFDVITIDPPWQLSSANPTRGVAIAYDTLNDKEILNLNFDAIQTDGFLFIWVINAKYRFALDLFDKYGYKLVDEIAWVKQTVNGKIAKGHGYYLQHAKETCLVGVKGNVQGKAQFNIESDVIFSQRRGQSQKPEEIYEIAEALVPNGFYLEIFGRRNNLHNGWVTIGNEL